MNKIDYQNTSSYCFVYDTLGEPTTALLEINFASEITIPYLSNKVGYTFVLLSHDLSVNEFKQWLGSETCLSLENVVSSYDPSSSSTSSLSHPYKYELHFKEEPN